MQRHECESICRCQFNEMYEDLDDRISALELQITDIGSYFSRILLVMGALLENRSPETIRDLVSEVAPTPIAPTPPSISADLQQNSEQPSPTP